jgi:hypothetical protein
VSDGAIASCRRPDPPPRAPCSRDPPQRLVTAFEPSKISVAMTKAFSP